MIKYYNHELENEVYKKVEVWYIFSRLHFKNKLAPFSTKIPLPNLKLKIKNKFYT